MSLSVHQFQLPLQLDANGRLGIIEFASLNFLPKRIYWLSDIPSERSRGRHAHKSLKQLFVLIRGSICVEIYRGSEKTTYELTNPGESLELQPGLWRNICDASPEAVLLVVCDQPYSENDYIRDFDDYLVWFEQAYA